MATYEELTQALAHLKRAQERLKCWPDCWVTVNGFEFCMGLLSGSLGPRLDCRLSPEHLDAVLHRRMHWNNLEIGCHILFDRRPNIYMPDVHTLMSFFHL